MDFSEELMTRQGHGNKNNVCLYIIMIKTGFFRNF